MSKYIFNNDTDILEFLEQLRENGIQIWGEGEKIRYRSKNRQLAPETLNRHEMLRAKVTEVGFEILERDEIDYEIKIVNLQKMAEREKVDTLSKIREDFSEYVFHTEEPPLFKVLITKRIEGNFFHLLVDLIVSDFASVQLLISEMGELLKGASLEKMRYTCII